MTQPAPILSLLAALWVLAWAVLAARRLLGGERAPLHWLMLAFSGLYALPLVYDALLGLPTYANYIGFDRARADPETARLYALYIACCPLLWVALRHTLGPPRPTRAPRPPADAPGEAPTAAPAAPAPSAPPDRPDPARTPWLRGLLIAICLLPLAVYALAPDRAAYHGFGVIRARYFDLSPGFFAYHFLMETATTWALVAAGVLLAASRARLRLLLPPLLGVMGYSAWLYQKRLGVGLALLLVVIALWSRGRTSGRALLLQGLAALLALGGMWAVYVARYGGAELAARAQYANLRVYTGRDDALKVALYDLLHPTAMPIARPRSAAFAKAAWRMTPFLDWPARPDGYATLVHRAIRAGDPPPGEGTPTTCWLAQSATGLGWMGLLLGPLALGLIAVATERLRTPSMRLLGVMTILLLFLNHVETLQFIKVGALLLGLLSWIYPWLLRTRLRPLLLAPDTDLEAPALDGAPALP